ncbi:MAG: DUF1836 domain-containing protein [Lachnospirales bacterium]
MDTQINIFSNIDSYRDTLLVSNVIDFFNKNNIKFTRDTISNYLKLNILPPLDNKKYYNKHHLFFLFFISKYKEIYRLEEIGKILKKIDADIGIEEYYNQYISTYTFYSDRIEEIIKKNDISKYLLLSHLINIK